MSDVVAAPRLAITAIGMVSSLGLDAQTACAAARAGLAQPRELDFEVWDEETRAPVKVFGHTAGLYTAGFSELGRWVRLGSLALRDLVTRGGVAAGDLASSELFLNLPSGYYHRSASARRVQAGQPAADRPTFDDCLKWYEAGIVPKLFGALDLPAPRGRVHFGDEAGAVAALGAAAAAIAADPQRRCLVGGIDSLVDHAWLPVCDELGLLKRPGRAVGFMPGEGAALLVLESETGARRRGADVLATISAIAGARDERQRFSDRPPLGWALSSAIADSVRLAGAPPATVYADLNGDAVRALDWGSAASRLGAATSGAWGGAAMVVAAGVFGATRAASGFLAACMAARSFQAGYARSPSALVWVASDSGERGSFVVAAGGGGEGGAA